VVQLAEALATFRDAGLVTVRDDMMSEDERLPSRDENNAAPAEGGLDSEAATPDPATAADSTADPVADDPMDATGRPFDAPAAAMADAIEEEKASAAAAGKDSGSAGSPDGAVSFAVPELPGRSSGTALIEGIDLLRDVELDVKIELGRSRMLVDDVLRLGEGSVVELDKLAGDPVDVYVNDRLVARGEVLVLNDNFCVRINDIVREETDEEG